MALDPNISLGVRGIEIANPLAQYGQVAAIQNAQNQNQLAQFQLGAAQRADLASTAQNELYAKHFNPATGGLNVNALVEDAAKRGQGGIIPGILKSENERIKAAADLAKVKGETEEKQFKLAKDKLTHGWTSLGNAPTPQDAIKKLNEGVTKGYFDFATASAETQQLQNMTPEQYKQYRVEKVLGLLEAKDKLSFMLPKTTRQDIGGSIVNIQDNPMMPGYGMPIAGASIAKTPTFGETAAQGQLGLAQQKFAWEKANPGYELKEAEDGSIVGVNKRTLQAFPVSIGGAAPAAAPMAGAGMPGARLPAAPVQAIPGMTSVLDQQVPAAVPAAGSQGMPLMGKGTAMTESQSNATAYGMRMKEANAILDDLSKKGVLKGAVIEGTPLIGGALGQALPSVLGGTSAAQQQVNQAKSNFITAVLRKESGAVISDSEFDREDRKYFPQVNDSPAVIKQKENARKLAIKAIEVQAGPGAKSIQQLQPSAGGGVDTSNPLLR